MIILMLGSPHQHTSRECCSPGRCFRISNDTLRAILLICAVIIVLAHGNLAPVLMSVVVGRAPEGQSVHSSTIRTIVKKQVVAGKVVNQPKRRRIIIIILIILRCCQKY